MVNHLIKLQNSLKQELAADPYRYFHSLLVLDIARDLANYHPNISVSKLETAALMHDFSKHISLEEAKSFAALHHEEIPKDFQIYLPTLHAFMAGLKLKHMFEIYDKEILDAVTYHTTGKANFSELGLLLYIADFLASIQQKNPENLIAVYETAKENLYKAALQITSSKIEYLEQRQIPIHPLSSEFQEWLHNCSL